MRVLLATFITLNLCFLGSVFAQEPINSPTHTPTPTHTTQPIPKDFNSFKDRLYFGGNVGAWLGSTTYIYLQPLIGCKITKEFSIGGGFTYNYFSQNYGGIKYTSTIYGSNAFARYFILDNLFAQVGWDKLSVPDYTTGFQDSRTWVDNILLGGGYRQAFSDKGSFILAAYYNINQTPLSPYPNPIIQAGFNVGF